MYIMNVDCVYVLYLEIYFLFTPDLPIVAQPNTSARGKHFHMSYLHTHTHTATFNSTDATVHHQLPSFSFSSLKIERNSNRLLRQSQKSVQTAKGLPRACHHHHPGTRLHLCWRIPEMILNNHRHANSQVFTIIY